MDMFHKNNQKNYEMFCLESIYVLYFIIIFQLMQIVDNFDNCTFLNGNTKEDILKKNVSVSLCPFNKSQWGPKQYRTPLIFIVWTKRH